MTRGRASYDAIVVGLGGAGSAAAYHLALAGERVLGLEQFGPNHAWGSSHGRTRIYRTAYFEGPAYVPLVRRAQELWHQLEETSGRRIIQPTGGLMIGRPGTPTVAGARRTAEMGRLAHEVLSRDEVQQRFPQFRLQPEEVALFDPAAGVLFPENCLEAHAAGAVGAGAEIHYGEPVKRWSANSEAVVVETRSATYLGRSLVITAGPWTTRVMADLHLPLQVERQFVLWFPSTASDLASPDRMPVFLWDRGPSEHTYGIPDFGDGVKVGSWFGKRAASPESADRIFREQDADPVRRFVASSLSGVSPRETAYASCLYTNAPDQHFVLGRHPRRRRVIVVSACSGHGFKFTSVIGEVISHLARGEPTGYDLSLFDPNRFDRNRRASKS